MRKKKKNTIKLIVRGSKWNFISDLHLACVAGGISVAVLCIVLVPELREAWVYKSITSRGGSDTKKSTLGTRISPSTQENLDLNCDQVWRYRGGPPPPPQTSDPQIGRGHDRRLTWACLAATTGSMRDLTGWKGHWVFLPFSTERKSDANCEIDAVKAYKVAKFNRRLLFCFLYHCLFAGVTRGEVLPYESHLGMCCSTVGFLRCFGLKTGIDFAHFGPESGMVYEGTTVVRQCVRHFNSKWVRKKV